MRYKNQKIILSVIVGSLLSFSAVSAKSFNVYNSLNATQSYFSVNGLTGNVGVGTTAPDKKITVNQSDDNGGIRLYGSTVPSSYFDIFINSLGNPRFATNNSMVFDASAGMYFRSGSTGTYFNDSTARITSFNNGQVYLNTVGNVGIGTTTPVFKLDVLGTGSFNQPVIVGTPTGNTHATTKSYVDSLLAGGSGSTVGYWTMNGTSISNSNGGNVGIGITNPYGKLHVYNTVDGTFNGLILDNRKTYGVGTGINETNRIAFALSEGGDPLGSVMGYVESGVEMESSSTHGWMTFGTRLSGVATEKMRINSFGNVGIGTTAPFTKLHVVGPGSATDMASSIANFSSESPAPVAGNLYGIFIDKVNYGGLMIGINKNTTTGSVPANAPFISNWSSNGMLAFGRGGSNGLPSTVDILIGSAGNVGIANNNPVFKLDVAGTGQFTQPVIVGTPTGTTHATTKSYVDSLLAGGSGSTVGYWTMNGANINNSNGGNVGIGTTIPGEKLHIVGDTYSTGLIYTGTKLTGVSAPVLLGYQGTLVNFQSVLKAQLEAASSDTSRGFYVWDKRTTNTHQPSIAVANPAGNDIFGMKWSGDGTAAIFNTTIGNISLAPAGNVGINTSTPVYKLDVLGTGSFTQPVIVGTPTGATHAATKSYVDGLMGSAVGAGISGQTLRNNGTGWVADSILFNNGTNVGIGRTNPTQKLHVEGVSATEAQLLSYEVGAPQIVFNHAGAGWGLIQNNAAGKWSLGYNGTTAFDVLGTSVLTWTNGGNVGIANTNPLFKLDVAGTGQFTQPVIVGTPTGNTHATTKSYVDSLLAGGAGSTVGYWTMNGTNINSSNSGNVGIGLTAPTQKLDVSGNILGSNIYAPGFENFRQTGSLTNKVIGTDVTQIAQSPIPGFLWHDILAFSKIGTPVFETSVDGTNWVGGTLDKRLFSHVENQSITVLNAATQEAVRWTWSSGTAWSSAEWMILAYSFSSPGVNATISIDSSVDGVAWTNRHLSTFTGNAAPYWLHVSSFAGDTRLRLTITSNAATGSLNLSSIRLLTSRWGDQGLGSELSYPYTWDGDQNISFPGNLTVDTNTLFVDSASNEVGIGVTNPAYKLDVAGTGQFNQPLIVGTPTGATHATTKSYVDGLLGSAVGAGTTGQTLRNDGAGWVANSTLFNNGTNVGIGMTNPGSAIDVASAAITTGYWLDGKAALTGESADNWLRLNNSGSWSNGIYSPGVLRVDGELRQGSADAGTYGIQTSGSLYSATGAVLAASSGNVGVGITNPGAKLDVNYQGVFNTTTPGTTTYGLHFSGQSTADYANGITWNGGSGGAQAGLYVQGSGAYGTKMYLATTQSYATGAQTRMMINQLGNVGIANTNPVYKLDVAGTANFTQPIIVGTPTGNTHATTKSYVDSLLAGGAGSTVGYWTMNGTNINNSNSGNVGIGTTSPSQLLDIYGNDPSYGFQDSTGSLYSASLRYKDNVLQWIWGGGIKHRWETSRYVIGDGTTDSVVFNSSGNSYLNGGNLGIGITNPLNKLQIGATGYTGNDFVVGNANGSVAINNNSGNSYIFGSQRLDLLASGVGISILTSGNVGVGITNPATKLDVSGGVRGISDSANAFGNEKLNTFLTYVSLGNTDDNVTNSIILLHPAYNGTLITKYFYNGKILFNRGGSGAGNIADEYEIQTSVAYNTNVGSIKASTNTGVTPDLITCDYGGVKYIALKVNKTSTRTVAFKGELLSTLSTPTLLSESSVTNVASINAPLLSLRSSGSIGIGLASPSYKLDVSGTGQFTQPVIVGTPTGTTHATTKSYVDSLLAGGAGSTVGYWTMNGTNINNSNSGNVGIGTTAPGTKLEVVGDNQFIWANGNGSGIKVGPSGATASIYEISGNGRIRFDNSYDNGDFSATEFRGIKGGSWNTPLTLLNNGNVGIGVTNPAKKLDIDGQFQIDNDGQAFWGSTANQGVMTWDTGQVSIRGVSGNALNLGANGSNVLTMSTTGNVGIGLTSPTKKFQIGDASNSASIYNDYLGSINHTIFESRDNNDGGAFMFRSNSDSITNNLMTITRLGEVGIGLTNPSYKLDVSGTGNFTQPVIVGTPTGGTHAATKSYVDSLLGAGSYLPLSGGALTGSLNMGGNNITNINKLTVTTIDPLYNIKGINYSTFASSIAGGVKEEYVGKGKIAKKNAQGEYELTIDFDNQTEGSDLWVWHKTVDFSDDNVQVLLTPSGKSAQAYYLISGNKLILRADKAVTVSYRLIGRRLDWRSWPTKATDQNEKASFIIK